MSQQRQLLDKIKRKKSSDHQPRNFKNKNETTNETSFGDVDPRFAMMHNDPKFLPVEKRTVINDPRLYEILDPSFTMLKKSRDASGRFREQAIKNTLKDIYNFEKDPMALRVAKLKQAKKEMEEEEGKEDHDSDYDSDDSIEGAKEMLGKNNSDNNSSSRITKEDILASDDEDEKEEDEEISFDKFLESLEGRPELENVEWNEEWDDPYDFDDEDATILRAVGTSVDEAEPEILQEQQDLWDKYVEDQKDIKMIEDGNETKRFAVMNCDWNLVDSSDLYVLFSSMAPSSGRVISVTVYLSDFGKQQLEYEAIHGPGSLHYTEEEKQKEEELKKKIKEAKEDNRKNRLVKRRGKKNSEDVKLTQTVEEAEGDTSMLDPVKVREYELRKMKYYFAVVECDSVQTAVYLYNECDGFEFESTSVVLDLRFIPDDISFEKRQVKNQCTSMPADYTPKQNIYSKALKSSSIDLTWDADDPEREILKKDFKDINEEALMKFIANSDDESSSSSSEEENDEETPKDIKEDEEDKRRRKQEKREKKKEQKKKYKDLLKYAMKKEKEKEQLLNGDASQNMEFVLHEGLKDTIQKEVVNKQKEKEKVENETWWETAERRRKEKKKQQRKERLKKILNSDGTTPGEDEDGESIDEDDLLAEQKLKEREKERQKKKEEEEEKRKQTLEIIMADYNAEKGFDIKRDTDKERSRRRNKNPTSSKKGTKAEEAPLIIGDERFGDVLLDPDFHLDQTHPKYKKTEITAKIMEKRREESLKRQEKEESFYANQLKSKKRKL
ncbi:hypothetical protein C9374_010445 [Naegleria lovaniensis]|uniref:NUC153 domain-containing protein n=1 Tax=Naegleria lovaniensis TaxID=51637 RepID=A0AA88GID1_NAELO|nr:uncharacterized protein C9374_010445 [Naegleria lovaniensis]KAG2374701.1 hypothetical protein C9374_010445 [Naegleria lovaniensis]